MENQYPGKGWTALSWTIGIVILPLIYLAASVVVFTPILLVTLHKIPTEIVFFSLIGYSMMNMRSVLKMTTQELEDVKKTFVENRSIWKIVLPAIYVDFVLVLMVGWVLSSLASAAIILPFVWYLVEYSLIQRNRWYFTPTGLAMWLFLKLFKSELKVPIYSPVLVPLVGKVQRIIE